MIFSWIYNLFKIKKKYFRMSQRITTFWPSFQSFCLSLWKLILLPVEIHSKSSNVHIQHYRKNLFLLYNLTSDSFFSLEVVVNVSFNYPLPTFLSFVGVSVSLLVEELPLPASSLECGAGTQKSRKKEKTIKVKKQKFANVMLCQWKKYLTTGFPKKVYLF